MHHPNSYLDKYKLHYSRAPNSQINSEFMLSNSNVVKGEMLKNINDNLVLRRATPDDSIRVADFMAEIFRDPEARLQTLEFMSARHPGIAASDFTVVEDVKTSAIVSSLCLMSRRWRYGKILLNVDEIATVGTHPDYRGLGLVRAQMDMVHNLSHKRGSLVQGILGIPWFYRQFGYEPALEDSVRRVGKAVDIANTVNNEKWRVRLATKRDVSFIIDTHSEASIRHLISAVLEADRVQYSVLLRLGTMKTLAIIESQEGKKVGFLSHRNCLQDGVLDLSAFELIPRMSWKLVSPSVLRYLRKTGEEYAGTSHGQFSDIALMLGTDHPMYLDSDWPTITTRPHAWYIRVVDIVAFICAVTPTLNLRMSASDLRDYTGEVKVSFGDTGIRISLSDGIIKTVGPWGPTKENRWSNQRQFDAIFPGLTFLQLIFGFRSAEDLEYAFPD